MQHDPEILAKSGLDDLRECPDCRGSGIYQRDHCSLCKGKGGLNMRTGEAVPVDEVPLGLGGVTESCDERP